MHRRTWPDMPRVLFPGGICMEFPLGGKPEEKKIYRNYFKFNTVVMGEIWGDDDVPF